MPMMVMTLLDSDGGDDADDGNDYADVSDDDGCCVQDDGQVGHDEEDEEYLDSLWESARRSAWQDPSRPLSARELVQQGSLEAWWKCSWQAISDRLPDAEGYKSFLDQLQVEVPPIVASRLATVMAAFKHYDRPLEGESPLEAFTFHA